MQRYNIFLYLPNFFLIFLIQSHDSYHLSFAIRPILCFKDGTGLIHLNAVPCA